MYYQNLFNELGKTCRIPTIQPSTSIYLSKKEDSDNEIFLLLKIADRSIRTKRYNTK